MINEKSGHRSVWTIQKFRSYEDYLAGIRPYEISSFEDNVLLNEGITRLQNLLIGGGGTAFGNSNAYLGVGNSSGTAIAAATGLSGTSQSYRPMEGGYPSIANQTTTWRSVFAGDQANFPWLEFTVANGSGTSAENLNRRQSDQGVKASGTTWTLDLAITWS